jgi:hypothetical protein
MVAECAIDSAWSSRVEEHLALCPECAGLAQRWALRQRALRDLTREPAPEELASLTRASATEEGRVRRAVGTLALLEPAGAPAELDGRVVAALQGGFLQDRAADRVRHLEPVVAPTALGERLEAIFCELRDEGRLAEPTAPRELEERVQKDLEDLPAAIARGSMSKLPRRPAPGELVDRVQVRLEGARTEHRSHLRPGLWAVAFAAAAALLAWASLAGGPSRGVQPERAWSFRVEYPADLEALSPRAREFGASCAPGLDAQLLGLQPESRVEIEREADSAAAPQTGPPGSSRIPGGSSGGSNPSQGGGGTQAASGGGPAGSSASAGGSGPSFGAPRFGPDYLNATIDAPFTVAYRGERRVLTRAIQQGLLYQIDYREEVAADGQGNFTILPRQVMSPLMDASTEAQYLALQARRESFFYRFRDFRIRDLADFWQNYVVQHLAQREIVAGRTCERFDIQRQDGTGDVFRVAIDPESSLVLSEERRHQSGELVSRIWFETFALNADLSDLQLTGGPSIWVEFDPQASPGVFNLDPLTPTAPPSGYELQSSAYATTGTPTGTTWARFIYGDGTEQAFFLSEDILPPQGNAGVPQAGLDPSGGDSVRAYAFGEWSLIEGRVAGRNVLAIGKVDEQELLLMLQSAVE